MALYPQSQAYGHTGYAAPQNFAHHQPMPPPTYYPPPPQPVYYDPTYFGRDYTARLSELTFNSRPIIQSLSLIAQEYTRYASTVIHCIESHIRRVSHPLHLSLSLISSCYVSGTFPRLGSFSACFECSDLCSTCHVSSVSWLA